MNRVGSFYDKIAHEEWERLGHHRMEFAITMGVLEDHLPPPPADVLDIGSGPGRYAIALAQKGYAVTLGDVSGECLALACQKSLEGGVELKAIVQANATELHMFGDASFDAVLMLGPLYHLLAEQERGLAVAESGRVLKPGGLVFAAFVTTFGVLRYAAIQNPEWIVRCAEELLATGVPSNSFNEGSFPGYFVHPQQVAPLMESGGFVSLDLVATDGLLSRLEERVSQTQGEVWQAWVDVVYRLRREPALFGASDHLLYVGRKPVA